MTRSFSQIILLYFFDKNQYNLIRSNFHHRKSNNKMKNCRFVGSSIVKCFKMSGASEATTDRVSDGQQEVPFLLLLTHTVTATT